MNASTRRRGDELQNSIYEVTYDLLEKDGYENISFSKIAQNAHTSRSVLYRYWDQVFDLVLEAILYKIQNSNNVLVQLNFDKGSLANNLIYIGQQFIKNSNYGPNKHFKLLFDTNDINNDKQQDELNKLLEISKNSNLTIIDYVLNLAIANHEINSIPSENIRLTYFHLLRYYSWSTPQLINDKLIKNIVSEIILPAIKNSQK